MQQHPAKRLAVRLVPEMQRQVSGMRHPANTTVSRLRPHLTDEWQSIPELAWASDMRTEQATKGLRQLVEKGLAERRATHAETGHRILQFRRTRELSEMTFDFSGINLADASMLFHRVLAERQGVVA